MCRIVDDRLDGAIVRGSAALLANSTDWCSQEELAAMIFHVTMIGEHAADLLIAGSDPSKLEDHLVPAGTYRSLQ